MPMISLGDKLAASGERPTGFDYLRIGLALGVVCMHSGLTSYGQDADLAIWTSPLRPVVRIILPMFFALSGFLVAGSLLRTATLTQFLGLRAIRIYPALAVEVFLSALLLGPLLTTEPLGSYFTSPLFGQYLMNATGHIHYVLPGVFQDNPFPNVVNAQLWTVPFELLCYISLSILALIGVKKRLWLAPAALAVLMVAYPAARIFKHHGASPVIMGGVPGVVLVLCFLAGVSVFFYRDRLPWSAPLCILSGLATALLMIVPPGDYVVAPVATYFTVSLGLANPRKLRILRGADYSYGVFLYGFAIQQTLMHTLPWARIWWVNILLSIPLVTCFAAASWHLVEKPALKLRRFLQPRAGRQRQSLAGAMAEAVDAPGPAAAINYPRAG